MFRKLLTYEEAKRAVEAHFSVADLGVEEAVLLEAYNRVLAKDVAAEFDIPSFNISMLDGYAVRAADTAEALEEAPLTLKVTECINAGEPPKTGYVQGEAVEVVAGAPLPEGADAVVALEDAQREDDTVRIYTSVTPNENMQQKGRDIQKGSIVLKKGQVLGAVEIGVLAVLGFKQVAVQKIPIVAVLSVGDTVVELDNPLVTGKSLDLNGYSLSTAVMECGGKPVYFGVVPNERAVLKRVLETALASSDMVVACGGLDVAKVADSLGQPGIVVNGIAARPGKPFSAAFAGAKPILLLPSEPSAALLMYHLFARSMVQRLAGRPVSALRVVSAIAGCRMFSAKGSRTFALVKLMFDEKCRLIAQCVAASGAVSMMAEADGFVEIAENKAFVDVDNQVSVSLFRGYAGRN